MYERNAIVLERYFEDVLKYKEKNNLRKNYNDYCTLVKAYERQNQAKIREEEALKEFEQVSSEIKKIQKTQEKLYNKGAKLEYSRYIIFENIEEKPEEIRKMFRESWKRNRKK